VPGGADTEHAAIRQKESRANLLRTGLHQDYRRCTCADPLAPGHYVFLSLANVGAFDGENGFVRKKRPGLLFAGIIFTSGRGPSVGHRIVNGRGRCPDGAQQHPAVGQNAARSISDLGPVGCGGRWRKHGPLIQDGVIDLRGQQIGGDAVVVLSAGDKYASVGKHGRGVIERRIGAGCEGGPRTLDIRAGCIGA